MENRKSIVILGAGYAGLLSAVRLSKKLGNSAKIILVDKEPYQLFTFDLYEVATAEEEMAGVEQLKKAATLPTNILLYGTGAEFIEGEVLEINAEAKQVFLKGRTLDYDYLIIATGSISDDYGIKGAKEFALPLKTLKDALRIRNQIEFAFQAHTMDFTKKNLRFVVAGGGYTGCELAGELVKLKNLLCWKYNYPLEKVEILVVEAASSLIPGFSARLSRDAYARFKDLGVKVMLSSSIFQITQQFVELASGEKLHYDAVLWAVGVKGREIKISPPVYIDKKNRFEVNSYLQATRFQNIFALGDAACVTDKNGHPSPSTAQDAINQAVYLSKTLPFLMQNKRPESYVPPKHGFIVSIGGKWAIMDYNGVYIKGFFAYFVRELAHIRYLAKLMGWFKAIMLVWFQVRMFGRND